jgi:hypothetical protein
MSNEVFERKQNTHRLNSNKYIRLENLTYGMKKPCVLDVKLGIRKWKPSHTKFKNSTTPTHNFRLNGCKVVISSCRFISRIRTKQFSKTSTTIILSNVKNYPLISQCSSMMVYPSENKSCTKLWNNLISSSVLLKKYRGCTSNQRH